MALPKRTVEFFIRRELPILFVFSFIFWVFLFREFFLGHRALINDALPYFEHFKFFIDNIRQGTIPLWESTRDSGVPAEFFLRRIGEFNPFYFFILFLNLIGISYYYSYLFFLAGYYFLGLLGFYFLARLLFENRVLAFLAFLLLMFSSLGTLLFCSFIILEFVPMVWFFYFLTAFLRTPQKHLFLGACFCLMILLSTYIPLYFLTILSIVSLFWVAIFPAQLKKSATVVLKFIHTHKLFSFICFFLIIVSTMPGFLFYQELKSAEIVFPTRHFNAPVKDVIGVAIQRGEWGGVVPHEILKEYFFDLRWMELARVYVPFFALVLLFFGFVVRLNKRVVFIFLTGYAIFVMAIYDSVVYKFLYAHIFFFKYFRNFQFFFMLAVLPLFVLLCVEHLKILSDDSKFKMRSLRLNFCIVSLVHAACAFFIAGQKIIISSWIVLIFSFLFFVLLILRRFTWQRPGLLTLLWLAVVIQPVEVYDNLSRNASLFRNPDRYGAETPFSRLDLPEEELADTSARQEESLEQPAVLQRKFFDLYMATKWYNFLYEKINSETLSNYYSHKMLVYDKVEWMDEAKLDLPKLAEALKRKTSVALVADKQAVPAPTVNNRNDSSLFPQVVTKNSKNVEILNVDVNSIRLKTRFSREQFLVYNDNFHSGWQAFVNGKKIPIWRTNYAFKGLWVPVGENTVYLRFGTWEKYLLKYFLMGIFHVTLWYFIFLTLRAHLMRRSFTDGFK